MGYDGELVASTSPQDLTTDWADVGGEIDTTNKRGKLHLWIKLDINNSNNFRIKLLDKHASAGADEYERLIKSASASVVHVEKAYYEWNVDEDGKFHLTFDLDGGTDYVQVQAQVSATGATAAQIDECLYSIKY